MSASRTTGAHGGPTPRSRAVPAPAARRPLLLPLVIVFVVLVLLAGGSTGFLAGFFSGTIPRPARGWVDGLARAESGLPQRERQRATGARRQRTDGGR